MLRPSAGILKGELLLLGCRVLASAYAGLDNPAREVRV
jgi:hypothetical protein